MKALVGSWDHRPYRLLAENAALRTRVSELELDLRRAREERDLLRAQVDVWADADDVTADAVDVNEVALSAR